MNKSIFFILSLLMLLSMSSCQNKRSYWPNHIEDVYVSVVRFDEAILNVRKESVREDVVYLYEEYPDFMPIFVEDILGIPVEDTAYLCESLPAFLEDTLYGFEETNQRVKEVFSTIDDIQDKLNQGFSRIHYLWPDLEIPTLYFMISGFQTGIYFFDAENEDDESMSIAVGTDMYLGSDWKWYNQVVYNYQKQTMRKECIAADVLSAYLFRTFSYTGKQNRLLDNMIYRGKVMYLLSQLLDNEEEYEIMGYTKDQWNWCKRYEKDVWHLIMDKKDLFKTEQLVLTSYLNDGPFTAEISQESPARLGTWIGWQIVKSYMQNNKTISLQDLIANDDAQYILENSYYKP